MDIEIPAWLTKEFIKKSLEYEKDFDVTIEDMKINMPVPKGNNYATDIYGVKVQYRRSNDQNQLRQKSFILKVPIEGPMYDIMLKSGFIQKEAIVYNEYLPKLKSIYNQNDDDGDDDMDDNDSFLAKSYFSTEENVVVLEDLKVKGYKMVDRVKQLDYEHCILALKSLAKFHAGSVVVLEKYPELFEKVSKEALFSGAFEDMYSSFIKVNFAMTAKNLKKYPQFEKYTKWYENNQETVWDKIVDEVALKENELGVLNHGDFWLTNMLFKYNAENLPVKNIPLDLQACRYSTPALDFLYFIDSSAQETVRNERFDDLIDVYLGELNSTLERLGIPTRLTESEFRHSIRIRTHFRIGICMNTLSIVIADPKEINIMDIKETNPEDFKLTENNPFESYIKNKKFIDIISKRMEQFENDGLIKLSESKMEFEIPTWLTKDYIQKALEHGKEYKVIVEDITVTKPVAKGNNYATDIYGVKAEYRKSNGLDKLCEKSFIIKSPLKGPLFEIQCMTGYIQKESIVYNEYLPKLKSIWWGEDVKDYNDEEYENLTANSYFSAQENVVVLEDLKEKGYEMVDRVKQLDYEHSVLALKTLSKWHAGSVVLHEKDPKLVEKIGKEVLYCPEFLDVYSQILKSFFTLLEKILKARPNLNKYFGWFEKNQDKILNAVVEEVRRKEDEFNVLNHGDYWLTNMLFKYEKDEPMKLIPIDLQACRYGSPALDIIYFFDGSVQDKVRDENFDDLIEIYVEELNSNLEKYGSSKRLEAADLKESIASRPYLRCVISTTFLPMVIVDPDETEIFEMKENFKSMEDLKNIEQSPFENYFQNERFLEILAKRLEEFTKAGIFKEEQLAVESDDNEKRETNSKLQIPEWLTKEYIQKALENGKSYSVIVEDMKVNMPVPKGNNYATDIYGVKVHYRRSTDFNRSRKKSFILKVPIKGPMYDELTRSGIYQKETMIYNKFLPKLKSVLGENDDDYDDDESEKDENLMANSYYSTEKYIVVLEDLKIKGYKMVDRLKQLDYEHCSVALTALAKFHAGSVALHEKDPELVEMIGREALFHSDYEDAYSGFVTTNFEIAGNNLKAYPEIEKYADWLAANQERSWKCLVDEIGFKQNEFLCLNHGDFWLTNMLFKYNRDGKPIKNIPLDLQCSRYTTPAADFIYFIDSSAQEAVRTEKLNELIGHYLSELNSNLKKYGSSKRLSESDFKKSISRLQYFRLYVNLGILPFVIADTNEVKLFDLKDCSADNIKNKDNHPMGSYLKSERFLKTLVKRFQTGSLITV